MLQPVHQRNGNRQMRGTCISTFFALFSQIALITFFAINIPSFKNRLRVSAAGKGYGIVKK